MGVNWWRGNWWRGGSAAPSSARALDDRIMDQVQPTLEEITEADGYHQDVTVYRPPIGALEFKAEETPALVIRRAGKSIRTHVRRAEEFVLTVKVICIVPNEGDDPRGDLADLIADVKRVVYLNRRWNDGTEDLARRTWFVDDADHETEVDEETLTGAVTFQILARADRQDLTQVKEV